MLMQTKSNLRAQSRGDSGFARVFTIMAMLLLMSTGAWAQEWISGITNGDFSGDDVSSFCKKVYPSTDVVPVVIGANVGKNGTPGIVVKSGDATTNPNAQNYDTQFWIVLPEEIPAGSSIRVQFDYKASKAVKASTELHADPKSYLTWNAIGDVNFTTEWKTFNREFTVPNDGDGMKSIAFDLQWEKSATDYYFDNFSVSYKKSEWTNIIVNSDMEGTDVSCYYVKDNALGSDNIYLAHITDGIGKDDSRAIRVRSTGNEENTYDTQFFIRLPYELPAGTKYRLSFDHKADKEGDTEHPVKGDFQCANEPKEYIIWYIGENDYEDFSFTTEWQHYKRVYNVPSVCNGEKHSDGEWLDNFQTIYFSLAMDAPDGEATEYIIDNVKVEILNSVLPTLTPSPVTDPNLMVAYPPYTVSLAEGTVDADKWTITPAEGAYEGETVTVTYSGNRHVKSVKATSDAAPAANPNAYLKWDNTKKELVEAEIPAEVTTVVNTDENVTWAAGTYVVEGDVTINGKITLNGAVDLIIKDGAKLTANQINGTTSKYNLSIYGQANQTGQLVVNCTDLGDAIRSITTLEVHSCQVKSTASQGNCSGFYNISTFNVYGGSVDSENTGTKGNGIWLASNNSSMNIYGGEVKAVGKGDGNGSYGIMASSSSSVTVYGGKLWAECAGKAALHNITLTKGAGFTGKIETSSDGSSWTEYTSAGTPDAKYVRVGY